MLKKTHRKNTAYLDEIGPWGTLIDIEENNDMTQYCDNILKSKYPDRVQINTQFSEKLSPYHQKDNRPKINADFLSSKNKQNIKFKRGQQIQAKGLIEKMKEKEKDFFQLNFNLNCSRTQRYDNNLRNQATMNEQHIKNSNRILKLQKANPYLQELSIQNFLVQGSRQLQKDVSTRRKESRIAVRNKFTEMRRSMNLPLKIGSTQYKLARTFYQQRTSKQGKQNRVLRLIKFDCKDS